MAKIKKEQLKTLFFINGPKPNDEQIEEANSLSGNVVYRNAHKVSDDAALEAFDAVAGDVPKLYREAADAKAKAAALAGEPEGTPEPVAALPAVGSPIAPPTRPASPRGKIAAAAGWQPNA